METCPGKQQSSVYECQGGNQVLFQQLKSFFQQTVYIIFIFCSRNWSPYPNLSLENEKKLTDSGKKEQENMAIRMKTRMAGFFGDYNENIFLFRHSPKERTKSSAEAFVKGLFPGEKVVIGPQVEGYPITR